MSNSFTDNPEAANHPGTELSVYELWAILCKRKLTIFAVFLLFLIIGILFAVLREPTFEYRSVLELGILATGKPPDYQQVLLEQPQRSVARINESYIPSVIADYQSENPQDDHKFELVAVNPDDSDIVLVVGEGKQSSESVYVDLLRQIAQKLIKGHANELAINRSRLKSELVAEKLDLDALRAPSTLDAELRVLETKRIGELTKLEELEDVRIIEVQKRVFEAKLQKHQKKIASWEDEYDFYQRKLKRRDTLEKLLGAQVEELKGEIFSAKERRISAQNQVSDAPQAMTLLMIDQEIQTSRERLAKLDERLRIDLSNEKEELQHKALDTKRDIQVESILVAEAKARLSKLALDNARQRVALKPVVLEIEGEIAKLREDNGRAVANAEQRVSNMETLLANLRETRSMGMPVRSAEPIGPSTLMILILLQLFGGVVSISLAFILEFLNRAKQQSGGPAVNSQLDELPSA